MYIKKYERPELEVILYSTADVLLISDDEYEGWNPGGSGNSGGEYEGWITN